MVVVVGAVAVGSAAATVASLWQVTQEPMLDLLV
jgi:hypothetical protein